MDRVEKGHGGCVMTDSEAQKRRVAIMRPIVRKMVRAFARTLPDHVDQDDLFGAGMVGVADALKKREHDSEGQFVAYATCRARGEIREELRRLDPLTRVQRLAVKAVSRVEAQARAHQLSLRPLAKAAGMSPEDVHQAQVLRETGYQRSIAALVSLIPASTDEPDDAIDDARTISAVREAADALSPRHRRALDCYDDGLTLREVGVELGVSEARVSQLRKEAVQLLRVTFGQEREAG